MDTVSFVNNVGFLINNFIKNIIKLPRVSITNIVILIHLEELLTWAEQVVSDDKYEDPITQEDINKLKGYISCLKKEIDFFPVTKESPDCILTEVDEHIIQE